MKRTGRIVGLIMGCVLLTSFSSFGQDLVSERAERRSLVGCPTAFTLPRASFDFDIHTFPNGGVQGAVHIGLLDQFMIGLSYGAEKILGETKAQGNPRMEVSVKLRLLFTIPRASERGMTTGTVTPRKQRVFTRFSPKAFSSQGNSPPGI